MLEVFIKVKPESIDAFKAATVENARNSAQEPGVVRFDFFQQDHDPTIFRLVEVYRTEAAVLAHKDTAHYLTWRDTVPDMMAAPRKGERYTSVFPPDDAW